MENICCGACHVQLKLDDIIIIDDLYTLFHRYCFKLDFGYAIDVSTFENIKEKYDESISPYT